MGLLHKFGAVRSGRTVTKEPEITPTTTSCGASDKYEVVKSYIGHGNSAEVKLVKRRCDGQILAVKIFSNNAVSSKRVQAEFYIAHGLRHRNIIATFDLCNIGGSIGMVMEYAPSCLYDLVSASKLQPGDSERYLADLISGVGYIHRQGFAHRDLKLENVVIGADGYAKVIDFGTVGVARVGATSKCIDTCVLEAHGYVSDCRLAIIGSSAYMAPELFTEPRYDPRNADVWSLGVVYACMVLGRFPWSVAQQHDATFAAYYREDLKLPASDLTSKICSVQQNLPSLIRRLRPDMQVVIHSMLRVWPAKRSGLDTISQRICHIRNERMQVIQGADVGAATPPAFGVSRSSKDHSLSSETYRTKASSNLSGDTLCTVIELKVE